MKVRIKFRKYGAMKFVGHLDVLRYFQKLFRRADIDNEFTKGFSPHQIMTFAAPLGVGLTSDAEYLDIQLLSSDSPEVMLARMNTASTEGVMMIDFHPLLEREENMRLVTAMSLVSTADYLVSLKDGFNLGEIRTQSEFMKLFTCFMNEKEIIINKKTKNSEKTVDIRPMITLTAYERVEYENLLKAVESDDDLTNTIEQNISELKEQNPVDIMNKPLSVADIYENGIRLYLQMDTGSVANLKPELVIEAFCNYYKLPFEEFAWQVHRLELYSRNTETGKLISLDQLDR
jgi:radical SAM-linked protein